MITRSSGSARPCATTLGGGRILQDLELLVERKLLDESVAKHVVVIDDQNSACGHLRLCCSAASGREAPNWLNPLESLLVQV